MSARPARGGPRLDHVLRVGAQRAALRTAPTGAFGDTQVVERARMEQLTRLLTDAELYELLQRIPRESFATLLERLPQTFSREDDRVAMANLMGRLYEARRDVRGREEGEEEEDESLNEYILRTYLIPPGTHPRVAQFLDDVRNFRVENVRQTLMQSPDARRFAITLFEDGTNGLMCAIEGQSLELTQLFMSYLSADDLMYRGGPRGKTALMYAAEEGLEYVEALLPKALQSLNVESHRGFTALDMIYFGIDETDPEYDQVYNRLRALGAVHGPANAEYLDTIRIPPRPRRTWGEWVRGA